MSAIEYCRTAALGGRQRSRRGRLRPQIEIPIAIDCAPRVPSSGTFVRLPAPETLHDSGLTALKLRTHEAVAAVLSATTEIEAHCGSAAVQRRSDRQLREQ